MRVAYVASSPACPAVLSWGAVGLIAAFTAFALAVSNVHVRLADVAALGIGIATMACLVPLQSRIDKPALLRLIMFLECFNLFAVLGASATLCSYGLTPLTGHFVDTVLASFDRSAGLDWIALYRFVDSNPWIQVLERRAYLSFFLTPIVLLGWFCATGRMDEARKLIMVCAIALALTLALFPLSPAMGPYSYYGLPNVGYHPVSSGQQLQQIQQIKTTLLFEFETENVTGLVSFPSFHCASGLIYIWTVRHVRWLRWPIIALNVLMIGATPIEGNHYFFDLLGGAAVAVLAICSGRTFLDWYAQRPMSARVAPGGPAFV